MSDAIEPPSVREPAAEELAEARAWRHANFPGIRDEPPFVCTCGVTVDPEFHRQSGGLCGDCLANEGMPLSTIGPPFISGDDLLNLMARCFAEGLDPYPIMADELRAMGWTVEEPDAD